MKQYSDDSVKTIYLDKIKTLKQQEAKIKSKSRMYLYAKLTFFAIMIVSSYMTFKSPSAINISGIVLFLIAYIVSYVLDDKCRRRIDSIRREIKVCKNELSYLKGDFTPFNTGAEYINPKHEYSYDLDIFGKSSLYNRINRTITKGGSDNLAKRLTTINFDKKSINNNQQAIVELSELFDWRVRFTSNEQSNSNLELLSNYIFRNKHNKFIQSSKIPYITIAMTMAALILNIFGVIPIFWFVVLWSVQIIISIMASSISSKTNSDTERLHKEYSAYLNILKDIDQQEFRSKIILDIKDNLFDANNSSLDAFNKLSTIINLFEQRNNAILYLILNGVFLYDILLIRMFNNWGKKYLSHVEDWINDIAEIDTLVSLGTYSFNNPNNVLAEVLDNTSTNVIEAIDFYHPFLSHSNAVANNFTLKKNNTAIVTGANMAGKSTFLRTVGITYVLANNGVPVCARSFKFVPVSLFSSMRTTDDLSNDISYFNAELIRLGQLIEHVKSNDFTLIILDEILKGTNSIDKLKGSIMFLEEISKYNVSTIVATHDLELAKLEEKESSTYVNYCFEIELSEEITYSYKIQNGVAQNLNASFLLSNILKKMK